MIAIFELAFLILSFLCPRSSFFISALYPNSSLFDSSKSTSNNAAPLQEIVIQRALKEKIELNKPWSKYQVNYIDPIHVVSTSESHSGVFVFIHGVVGVFQKKKSPGSWGHGESILMELLATLTSDSNSDNDGNKKNNNKKGALINVVDRVFVSLLGSESDIMRCLSNITDRGLNSTGKIQLLLTANNIYLSEIPTIYALEQFALGLGSAAKILYLHTKGVRKNGINAAYPADWRRYMVYFLVEHHSLCIRAIEEYGFQTCGVLKQRKIYAGNFWWSTAGFIQDRARRVGYQPLANLAWNMDNRYEAEVTYILKLQINYILE